jgi:hypothetical protein
MSDVAKHYVVGGLEPRFATEVALRQRLERRVEERYALRVRMRSRHGADAISGPGRMNPQLRLPHLAQGLAA